MPTQAEMKAALQAYIDGFNADDPDAIMALFADNAVIEDPVGSPLKSRAEFEAFIRQGVKFGARLKLAAPIREMSGFATRLAAGDLTADLHIARHDDLGEVLQALNQLKANLAAIVYDVRAQITGMLDNAREISSGNVDLARRTELQAASLEETAATMEQLTTTVQANADATVRALDAVGPAIYNITDDEPAPMREWLPALAAAVGARPPFRVPAWAGRLAMGKTLAMMTEARGASNARAKKELDWTLRYPTWRTGFPASYAR